MWYGVPTRSDASLHPMSSYDPSLLLLTLDLLGVFVFAVSGALVGVRKELDVFGVLVLGGTTGLGGGFLRDVLIDAAPPATLREPLYLLVAVAAGLATFLWHTMVGRVERAVNLFDAVGLAVFCVTGAVKAIDYGLNPFAAALMGMVTGIGGGMVRDVLAGRVPVVFRGQLYAIPALAGAGVAVLIYDTAGAAQQLALLSGAAFCLVWRLLAIWRDWYAPLPRGNASV